MRRLAAAGATDYLMVALEEPRFGTAWIAFASRQAGGFGEDDLRLLSEIAPLLSLRVQLIAAQLETESLLEVYLGKNASRRVLEGAFRRGEGEEIDAAIWFCDMRGFTALSDRTPARQVVAILDAYFEVVRPSWRRSKQCRVGTLGGDDLHALDGDAGRAQLRNLLRARIQGMALARTEPAAIADAPTRALRAPAPRWSW